MEEDIKDLEKYISFSKKSENFSHDTDWKWNKELGEKIEHLIKSYKEYEAVIEEMAEYLSIVRDCPNEDKGANLDCENRCSNDDNLYAECWKQYFRNKVKENKE